MLSAKIKSAILILLLTFFFIGEVNGEELSRKGRDNYILLKRAYDKWDSGLFGSRKYYRKRLNRLLIDLIDTEIATGQDFTISIPEVFAKRYYSSDLYNQNWLNIHGPADDSSIKMFAEKGNDYIKEVERNKYLFFLSGKIVKFRIGEASPGRYQYERNIHLYLETVKITQSIK